MGTDRLLSGVKYNCNVSDAAFWGYYSICGLLMRLREMFLSEHGMMPWENVPREEISSWIHERENLWKELEGKELEPLTAGGTTYDPFDVDRLNALFSASGLVYGCGFGMFRKPTFFVAELETVRELFDYRIFYSGREFCRDLSASVAMLQGRCVYLRRDILRALIWERFQTLKARRHRGQLDRMFGMYGIERTEQVSDEFTRKIDRMSRETSEIFVLHEVGEAYEDLYTGEWLEMLASGPDKYTELSLRAIKDLLADTSVMGPLAFIAAGRNEALLNAYVVFLDGLRKEIFPEMGRAYEEFSATGNWSFIEEARQDGYAKGERLRERAVETWKTRGGAEGVRALKTWIMDAFAARGRG